MSQRPAECVHCGIGWVTDFQSKRACTNCKYVEEIFFLLDLENAERIVERSEEIIKNQGLSGKETLVYLKAKQLVQKTMMSIEKIEVL